MMRKFYKLVVLLLLCQTYVFAQNISVTGKVTDTDNLPLPAVSIKVSGTTQGTSTDNNGNFTISVPSNASLVFSYIGFTSQTIAVQGRTTLNVKLATDSKMLEGVVVTALGIERSSKSLTYATTNVSAEDLNQVKGANVLNSLAGKAAGVFVTQGAGGPGSSPRIVLRGNKSIGGSNTPLYVVDGVPVGGFADFNPEDIESLQILQGASAAALYGSQAANGVILITTRKGKLGTTTVDFASTATYDSPFVLPELQTTYGQGLGGVARTGVNDSWGPKITNGSDSHIKDFFQTGENYLNSLSISSGNEVSRVYLSYANTNSKAMIPGYNYGRNNVTLRGSSKAFNNKLTLDGGINFIGTQTKNQNASSWYNSPMFGLYLFPMGDNMNNYSSNGGGVWNATRGFYVQNWPYIKNEHSSNQNPYWIINKIQSDDVRNRTNMNGSAKLDLTDWLNIAGRTTYNTYSLDSDNRQGASSDPINTGANGGYQKSVTSGSELYTDVLLSANKELSDDIKINAVVGFSNTITKSNGTYNGTNGANTSLYYADYFTLQGLTGNFVSTSSITKRIDRSVFGTASVGFKETLFLDVTGRNEWSSTTESPFFYPSAGLAYILTNTLGSSDAVSFAKLRATYAEVGNALPFGSSARNSNYSVGPDESVAGRGTLPFFSGTDTITLKPERSKSYEFGADLRFLKDKLNLSVTYYNATTEDQVFTITAPTGAGASNFFINGGTIQNQGVEATLSYNASFGNLKWTPSVNFSRNTNRIKELSNLLTTDRFVLQSGNRLTNLFLLRPGSKLLNGRKYGAYHDIFGKTYLYDANGNQQFNATTGLPLLSTTDDQYIGNANPDFLLNLNNNFTYKNFNVSFLVDGRFGGLVSSSTEQWLDYKGLSKRSGEARDAGGVNVNGKLINPELYYGYVSAKADFGAAGKEYTYSSTNIRLRELAIGYTLPKFSNTIKNVNLSLVGRNVLFFYKKAPFDPELALGTGNSNQGFESFQIPSATSIGLTLRAGF
jgi:TonB-linked SusC/RagA family outer membrane protein